MWWVLSAKDTFLLIKDVYKISKIEFDKNMDLFNSLLDLRKMWNRPVRQMSLGQRIKCELAIAFLHNPPMLFKMSLQLELILLLNQELESLLNALIWKKVTLLLMSHDLPDIEALCNRIIITDQGNLIFDGNIDELKNMNGEKRYAEIYTDRNIQIKNKEIRVIQENGERRLIGFSLENILTAAVIKYIDSKADILDVKIKDTPIEEAITPIYRHELFESMH